MGKEKLNNTPEEIKRVIGGYKEYAEKNGLRLNPNGKIVEVIARGLLEREKTYGFRYCPCRRITGNKEEDKNLICPCYYSKEEIEEQGFCTCRLFLRA